MVADTRRTHACAARRSAQRSPHAVARLGDGARAALRRPAQAPCHGPCMPRKGRTAKLNQEGLKSRLGAARPQRSKAATQQGWGNAARPNRAATRPLPIPCSRRCAGGAERQRFASLSRCFSGYRAFRSFHLRLTRTRFASRPPYRCPSPAQASAGSAKAEACAWETRVSLSCFQLVSAGSAKAEACTWAALGQAGAGVQPGKQDGRVHDKVSCPCPALLGPSQRSLPAACPELVGTLLNCGIGASLWSWRGRRCFLTTLGSCVVVVVALLLLLPFDDSHTSSSLS